MEAALILAAYFAVACVFFGSCLAVAPDEPGTCIWLALVWPISLLVALGMVLRRGR